MENSKAITGNGQVTSGQTEGRLMQDCFIWAWNELPETRGLLCYNLNNSKNAIDGNLNKAKGLIAGRSDFAFYWNRTAYFIEMKTATGNLEPVQKQWRELVQNAGYRYFVCRSLTEFQDIIRTITSRPDRDQPIHAGPF